jgi:hypothetical protein
LFISRGILPQSIAERTAGKRPRVIGCLLLSARGLSVRFPGPVFSAFRDFGLTSKNMEPSFWRFASSHKETLI